MNERVATFVERAWRGDAGVPGAALTMLFAPAELAFRALSGIRTAAFDHGLRGAHRVPIPVISVGNIATGGAGKTPFSAFLVRRLRGLGHRPALLHGGYADDEPMLHRQWQPDIPVYVGRDRVASASAAAAAGASVAVLDDGFQHRRLARDLDLVLVAAEGWTARPRLLPRGPWRETPSALRRASAVIVTHRTPVDPRAAQRDIERAAPGVPVWTARLTPERWRRAIERTRSDAPPREPVLVVAAVARVDLFAEGVRAAGAQVAEVMAFRDHHAYTSTDALRIRERAAGRQIVTTAKDWVKLRALLPPDAVWLLEQDVVMTDGGTHLDRLLSGLPVRA